MNVVKKTMVETRFPADGIQPVGCEGHDEKVMPFVSFCLECYKARHGMSGRETAELFRRHGVEKYLCEEYDVMHSFGERQILDYVERFIEVRKEAAK